MSKPQFNASHFPSSEAAREYLEALRWVLIGFARIVGPLNGSFAPSLASIAAAHKNTLLTLVERGGSARSFHIDSTSIADIAPILRKNIRQQAECR